MDYKQVGFADLELGKTVTWNPEKRSAPLDVVEIVYVTGVDIAQNHFGSTGLSLSQTFRFDDIEPRVRLRCGSGAWHAYWYPLRAVFVMVSNNGYCDSVISNKRMLTLYEMNTPA